jgi:hypothetical protein
MIDLAIIRERYAAMSDAELLKLAKTEGHELTKEAFKMLQEEFARRKLDLALVDSFVEENKAISREKSMQRLEDNYTGELQVLIGFAMEEKAGGSTDGQIHHALLEKGLTAEEATQIVDSLEEGAKLLLEAAEKNVMRGLLFSTVGTMITVYSFTAAGAGGAFIITWGAIVFGAIRLFKGLSEKNKYRRVLANIAASKSRQVVSGTIL